MDGTRALCALLVVAELGGGCSGKKSEPPPGREVSPTPTARAAGVLDAGAPPPSPVEAIPKEPAPPPAPPDPVASLFRRRYTPDESLPERMRRRIRYHLREKTKAPIALHHITYVPQAGSGGGDVFAIYEYSVYEDCVLGYADRKEGREQCTSGEPATISDLDHQVTSKFGQATYADKRVYLNRECVALGLVRAHFEPPGPDVPADAGGALTLWAAKLDGLCEAHNYNRLFVADLDGDERLEMYLDITTSEEKVDNRPAIRSEPEVNSVGHRFEQRLYLFAGDDSNGIALALELGTWESESLHFEELVELRDLNHDRRLDVIQQEFCGFRSESMDGTCGGERRRKTEYLYDPRRDAWVSRQEASEGAKDPAAGSAKEPASGSAKEPASGSAKAPAGGAAPP